MNSLEQVLSKLELTEYNGLYYYEKVDTWKDKFPYWIKRTLDKIQPDAFYCFGNDISLKFPFILFFDKPTDEKERIIHKQVWNFNQSPVVFIIKDNQIEVYNGFIFDKKSSMLQLIEGKDIDWTNFSFYNIQSGKVWDLHKDTFGSDKRVDQYLLVNIRDAISSLNHLGLNENISNNLIGRLIFSRYLIDRDVNINNKFIAGDSKEEKKQSFLKLILDKKRLYEYFAYLKQTFNGDLFPLEVFEIQAVTNKHLEVINLLFSGAEIKTGQLSFFDFYDFSIIPVELISNIYESFIGESKQKKEKAFYTPIFLVDYVLSQTVGKFITKKENNSCKVLDPSCGSGIFLVETLRKIIEKSMTTNPDLTDKELKSIVTENIYGIDKDENAINVAIFSLYITLLDYKNPKDITNFKFPVLKNTNFFIADFFDLKHPFNECLDKVNLDCIIGNPPWGSVKKGFHIDYCNKHAIPISDCQIAQSFIARTKDFCDSNTQCAMIVTSKILYNLKANYFRKYLLENFIINRVLELSAVRRQIFSSAIGPSAIIFYENADESSVLNNVVEHISIKPNIFFKLFKIIAIEKYDYKKILQRYFINYDWLWKVMLYGNVLDFNLIKELMSNRKIRDLVNTKQINAGVGFTVWEDHNTKHFPEFKEQEFKLMKPELMKSFYIDVNNVPKNKLTDFYRIGDRAVYSKPHILIQKAIKDEPIISFLDEDCIFEKKIFGICADEKNANLLKSVGAYLSSDLAKYLLFMLTSQWGIHIDEIYLEEYLRLPIPDNFEQSNLYKALEDIIAYIKKTNFDCEFSHGDSDNLQIQKCLKSINNDLFDLFNLSDLDKDLIDYAINVSLPLFKGKRIPYNPIKTNQLMDYVDLFVCHFSDRFLVYEEYFKVEIYRNEYFVALNFIVTHEKPVRVVEFIEEKEIGVILKLMGVLSLENINENLFVQKDIKGFEESSFFVIKPNEYKNWHKAVARLDINEFMDAILKAGKEELVVMQ